MKVRALQSLVHGIASLDLRCELHWHVERNNVWIEPSILMNLSHTILFSARDQRRKVLILRWVVSSPSHVRFVRFLIKLVIPIYFHWSEGLLDIGICSLDLLLRTLFRHLELFKRGLILTDALIDLFIELRKRAIRWLTLSLVINSRTLRLFSCFRQSGALVYHLWCVEMTWVKIVQNLWTVGKGSS